MTFFSIEQSAEGISQTNTRIYFEEVLQSYINGSYRSAVVMLYSVVVSDLIYKLKELRDLYNDSTADKILKDIAKKQERNPKSGDWEIELIKMVSERTRLLAPQDVLNITQLREQRHLCAHPVLTHNDLLSSPNKETVRALMRNMLEGVLTKGSIMTTKVLDVLLEDLALHKESFADDKSLEKFLDSKYFKRISDNLTQDIFKRMWRLTFENTNEECTNNRLINYRVIKIIYRRNYQILNDFIKENDAHFSRISYDTYLLERLFAMLGHFPTIYGLLESHTQDLIVTKADEHWTLRIKAPFLKSTMSEHFDSLNELVFESEYDEYSINASDATLLYKWAEHEGCIDKLLKFFVKTYTGSRSFDTAVNRFATIIEPYLNEFEEENLMSLFSGINSNTQCYNHRQARLHNSIIKEYSDKKFQDGFDYDESFPNIEFSS